jgi:mannose-1-phosphate guanylyltransferase
MTESLFAVILAGGRGTRFWPRSRRRRPKQLLRFGAPRSLLQATLARVRPLVPPSRTLVVVTRELAGAVRRELRAVPAANILVEPRGRNTAPAIALAAHVASARAADATLLVLPSDHHVGDPRAFREAARRAARFAARRPEALVVFGIRPTRPETGYGYIVTERTTARAGTRGAPVRVERFIEKPALPRARALARTRGAYWNAGVFVWRARTYLDALDASAPGVARPLARAAAAAGRAARAAALGRAYERVPATSADVAVLERSRDVFAIPVAMQWSDLGSWISLSEVFPSDGEGNVVEGRHVGIATRGSILLAPDKLIATIGVEDLIVVDTGDVLFLCRKSRAQDVRQLVRRLEARGIHLT